MAISTITQVKSALAIAQWRDVLKLSETVEEESTLTWHSLWKALGQPAAGATPGTGVGVRPTKATTGALPFVHPPSGQLNYLLRASMSGGVRGVLTIYDRLWHNSGLLGTQTTPDTNIGGLTVNRPDGTGFATELWGEIYSSLGDANATINVKYTDQDGNTNQSGYLDFGETFGVLGYGSEAGSMFPINLSRPDSGVRSCDAYHWSSSTPFAGNFGFVILRRLADIPLVRASVEETYDFVRLGLPQVYDDACLAMMLRLDGGSTTSGLVQGRFMIGAG